MGLPAIALVQMEVKPGRPDLNAERMLAFIAQAREAGAEVVVFSELVHQRLYPRRLVGDGRLCGGFCRV